MPVPATAHVQPIPDFEEFTEQLESLLNRFNIDNWADTPDYILAEHLTGALRLYRATLTTTRVWHGWKTLPERLNQR